LGSLRGAALVVSCGSDKRLCYLPIFLMLCALQACSGLVHSNTSNTGPMSSHVFVVTLRASPLSPGQINLLSFRATVTGLSLIASTGESVNVPLNSDPYEVDLSKLQSDSAFVARSTSVPAGTYSNLVVSVSDPAITFCSQLHGLMGCDAGSVSRLSGEPATAVIAGSPFPLVITDDQMIGLTVDLSLSKALGVDSQSQAVTAINLGAPNVFTTALLPPKSSNLQSTALDFVEDLTGNVTAVDELGQSVTLQTATRGAVTAVAGPFTVLSPNCATLHLGTAFTCAKQGQMASIDTTLNQDGTFSLLGYDPLAISSGDWIEGIIGERPSSPLEFQLVVNDFIFSPADSAMDDLELGSTVVVKLVNPKPFVVDSKGLTVPVSSFSGATDASVLIPGQTLAVHVTTFSSATGASSASAAVDLVYLRFTRITGTVAGAAPPNTFTIQSLPPLFGVTLPAIVQLSTDSPSTNFDGATDASSLIVGQVISARALYFGPPGGTAPTSFSAAKLRIH
jgi:hypothetical protein